MTGCLLVYDIQKKTSLHLVLCLHGGLRAFVENVDGHANRSDVEASDTIVIAIATIQNYERFPPDQQSLAGKKLEDGRHLSGHDIQGILHCTRCCACMVACRSPSRLSRNRGVRRSGVRHLQHRECEDSRQGGHSARPAVRSHRQWTRG